MKTKFVLVGLVLLAGSVLGQVSIPPNSSSVSPWENLSAEKTALPPETVDALVRAQTDMVYQLSGVNFSLRVWPSGVIPQAIRSRKPWNMINPFAPLEYGSGFHNVSVDPITGRAEGIRLIGFGF